MSPMRVRERAAQSIKPLLNAHLARWPWAYRALLRLRRDPNLERLAYLELIRDGMAVFDVGANVGYYTILFSHLVGPRGRVHAFEPVPPTFERLSARLSREGRFDNVALNSVAVANSDAPVRMIQPGADDAQAAVMAHRVGSWVTEDRTVYDVPATTLDRYAADRGVAAVDFIKLDVEGAELLVLKGAAAILNRDRPIIVLEYFPGWAVDFGYSGRDLIQYLQGCGYTHFYREDFRIYAHAASELETARLSTNVICSAGELP